MDLIVVVRIQLECLHDLIHKEKIESNSAIHLWHDAGILSDPASSVSDYYIFSLGILLQTGCHLYLRAFRPSGNYLAPFISR